MKAYSTLSMVLTLGIGLVACGADIWYDEDLGQYLWDNGYGKSGSVSWDATHKFFYYNAGNHIEIVGLPERDNEELLDKFDIDEYRELLEIPVYVEGLPVASVEIDAFYEYSFGTVRFAAGSFVAGIGDGAFEDGAIEEIDLSNCERLQYLSDSAFYHVEGCSILRLPNTPVDYRRKDRDFCGCFFASGHPTIEIPNWTSSCAFKVVDGSLYNNDGTVLICSAAASTLRIPEGVTTLESGSIYNNYAVERVELPSTLEIIHPHAFGVSGYGIRDAVSRLRKIKIG